MHIFRKKLSKRFGGMEYSQYFCIRFREHRYGGCLRDSKKIEIFEEIFERFT